MNELDLLRGAVVFFAAGAIAAGCGAEFATSGGTTTTTGSTGTGGSGGGTSSSSVTGGGGAGSSITATTGTGGGTSTTSTSGGGGTGGMMIKPCVVGDLSTCPAGEYCDMGSGICVSCTQPVSPGFAAPVKLGVSAPYPPLALFPRIGLDGQLLFRFRTNMNSDIGFALPVPGAALSWSSATPEPSPLINTSLANEESPLFLPIGTALVGLVDDKVNKSQPVLLFDRGFSGTRKLYAANLDGQQASLLSLKTQNNAFQVAVAFEASPPRFWYHSDFFANLPENPLVTTTPGEAPTPAPIVLDNGCHARGELMPWVTPDGAWMFFSATYPDPASGCAPQNGAPAHLFAVPLGANGLPLNGAMAQPIFPNEPSSQVSPSLSPDQCTLYFSQIGAQGSVMYGAVRR